MKIYIFILFSFLFSSCGFSELSKAKKDLSDKESVLLEKYELRSVLVQNLISEVKAVKDYPIVPVVRVTKTQEELKIFKLKKNNIILEEIVPYDKSQQKLNLYFKNLIHVCRRVPPLEKLNGLNNLDSELDRVDSSIEEARKNVINESALFNKKISEFPKSMTNFVFLRYPKIPEFETVSLQ